LKRVDSRTGILRRALEFEFNRKRLMGQLRRGWDNQVLEYKNSGRTGNKKRGQGK
jgi:hypothetical protein